MKFRKKPVEIEAWKCSDLIAAFKRDFWSGLPDPVLLDQDRVAWVVTTDRDPRGEGLYIPTLEGNMFARPQDWIIRGVRGEFYPCQPQIFDETYDLVEEAS